ncbi:MAG: dienelactone hydrolase [Ramlibacter sp.]|nr:dienelactone hydrolase [Ramlibacter sp.]
MTSFRALAVLAAAWIAVASSNAAESTATIRVKTADARGETFEVDMALTVFSPTGAGPFPAVILSHGRPGPSQRAAMGRVKLSSVATAFLGEGFVVVVPTRVGYGISKGPDLESAGTCEQPRYAGTFAAAADQVAAAAAFARTLDHVDGDRLFLVGHSMGGAATIAAAARNLPGVRAAVSFNGGQGGGASGPCRPDALRKAFAELGGARAAVPQLWIHVENDRLLSTAHARSWFSAFEEAGGRGEINVFPSYRDDGHWWFGNEPAAWMPTVRAFFLAHGLRP